MLTETINISSTTHESLSILANDGESFDDVIVNLIEYYNEEFSDEQAEFYNKEIEKRLPNNSNFMFQKAQNELYF